MARTGSDADRDGIEILCLPGRLPQTFSPPLSHVLSRMLTMSSAPSNSEPSFRPPTRNPRINLSLTSPSPSLKPPTSTRPRAVVLPALSITTNPTEVSSAYASSVGSVPAIPSSSDETSSTPSSSTSPHNDFGRQVRRCIGDEEPKGLTGQFERLSFSTSADGDDEATPPVSGAEIASLDEEGWRKAARKGGIVEINLLGEGSSGSVSRCRLRHGTQEFALKVITPGVLAHVDHPRGSTDAQTDIAGIVI
jgi:hypothetical protein